jgi:cation transport regulator
MPYNRGNLPRNIRDPLPQHAQDIWVEAFNSAYDRYRDPDDRRDRMSRDEAARRVAWSAVKKQYEKGDDGRWHPRE